MDFSSEVVRTRLKEAVGSDTQEVIAQKLHMTQGNVSKLLSGKQLPTLDTVFNISKSYGVSVDWLIGLTDAKRVSYASSEISYSDVTEALVELKRHGGCTIEKHFPSGNVTIHVLDPLMKNLVVKGGALQETDEDSLNMWKERKLSLFEDKTLISAYTWHVKDMYETMLSDMTSETEWESVYKLAKEAEQEFDEIFSK